MDILYSSLNLHNQMEQLNNDTDHCKRNSFSSRWCERGTKCCTVYHNDPELTNLVIGEKIDSCASILRNNSTPSAGVLQAGIDACEYINWDNDTTEQIVRAIYQATTLQLVKELRLRAIPKTHDVDD